MEPASASSALSEDRCVVNNEDGTSIRLSSMVPDQSFSRALKASAERKWTGWRGGWRWKHLRLRAATTHQTWPPDAPSSPRSCQSRWWDRVRCSKPPGPDGADCSGRNLQHTWAHTGKHSSKQTGLTKLTCVFHHRPHGPWIVHVPVTVDSDNRNASQRRQISTPMPGGMTSGSRMGSLSGVTEAAGVQLHDQAHVWDSLL